MPSAVPAARRLDWRDLVPALPLLAIGLAGTGRAAAQQPASFRPVDFWAYALVAVACLALLLRRRAPVACLVICGLATAAYHVAGYAYGPILFCGPAAAWAVASRLPWRRATAWTAAFVLVTTAARGLPQDGESWTSHLVGAAAWAAVVGGVAAIAAARQVRRRSEAGVREEQARRAVSEERLQMAQDVHDGVGHGLAVIAMHAGVALHVLDRDPEQARELLTSIQATSREALEGLRADLDRWRSGDDAAARRPAPGLDDLPQLLDRMRAGGLTLTERVERCPDVPEAVGAAAYRIVQESLTNVLRHAGSAPAEVRLTCGGGQLTIEVRDSGTGATAPSRDGSGIAGMRRRAAGVGGRLTAGPAAEGGFVVRATLPLSVPSPVETSGGAP